MELSIVASIWVIIFGVIALKHERELDDKVKFYIDNNIEPLGV